VEVNSTDNGLTIRESATEAKELPDRQYFRRAGKEDTENIPAHMIQQNNKKIITDESDKKSQCDSSKRLSHHKERPNITR